MDVDDLLVREMKGAPHTVAATCGCHHSVAAAQRYGERLAKAFPAVTGFMAIREIQLLSSSFRGRDEAAASPGMTSFLRSRFDVVS